METNANFRLVAIVGGLLLAGLLTFIYYLAVGTGAFDARYQIGFDKNVSGLTEGSPVEMQGVRVGRVESIEIDGRNPGSILVTIMLDEQLPIHRGVRADLSRTFIDGAASVILIPSREGPRINPEGPEIARIESLSGGRNGDPAAEAVGVVAKLDKVANSLDVDGQARISDGISRTGQQTARWERDVSNFLDSFSSRKIRDAARGIDRAGEDVEGISRSVQGGRDDVAQLRKDIRGFGKKAEDVSDAIANARPGIRSASEQVKKANEVVHELGNTVGSAKDTLDNSGER